MKNENKLKPVKSSIISCSRRTDIPAFLMDWAGEKIEKQAYIDLAITFNKRQISKVPLDPKDEIIIIIENVIFT